MVWAKEWREVQPQGGSSGVKLLWATHLLLTFSLAANMLINSCTSSATTIIIIIIWLHVKEENPSKSGNWSVNIILLLESPCFFGVYLRTLLNQLRQDCFLSWDLNNINCVAENLLLVVRIQIFLPIMSFIYMWQINRHGPEIRSN